MPSIFDWSSTAGSNTTVDGINVAEGCPSGNMNNALRSTLAIIRQTFASGLQSFLAGSSALAIANGGTGATSASAARTALGVPSIADLAGATATGMVAWFAMTTPPTGYLACDGTAVSRSTYSALYTAIGTTFGVGDGSTTFNLPDLRGEFIRGYDNGRGVDSGRVFGSAQADELESHTHETPVQSYDGTSNTGFQDGANYTGRAVPTSATGGTETRPRNIALLSCIKY